jgi:hypothetical protein
MARSYARQADARCTRGEHRATGRSTSGAVGTPPPSRHSRAASRGSSGRPRPGSARGDRRRRRRAGRRRP